MDTLTWVLGIVLIVVLGGVVMFAIGRRGQAGGEGNLGALKFRVWGSKKPEARIQRSKARRGGAEAYSSGDATILDTEVERNLRAEAGRDASDDPKG